MGRKRKKKHPSTRHAGDSSEESNSQSKLADANKFPHVTKSDINDILIPVIKEIGKSVYPPAALPIEILYQVYKHADAVKEVGSAILKGDYEQAAQIAMEETGKEAGETILATAVKPLVDKTAAVAADVSNSLPSNQQGRELAGKIARGAVKGTSEAIEDKVVKKAVEGMPKDEKR